MTTFDERKKAFESEFAHNEELKFRVEARANKLIGLWAAGLVGRDGEGASVYAREIIRSDFEEAGKEDVFRKLQADLGGRAEEATIRTKMAELHDLAKAQIMDES